MRRLIGISLLCCMALFALPSLPARGQEEEPAASPGLKERVEAWYGSQSWSGSGSYSWMYFDDELYKDYFDKDYFPMLRFGGGWYPVENLSIELLIGGMYEDGYAVGAYSFTPSGEKMQFYVGAAQLNLRYEFAFLEDQLLVPAVWAGGDWWYFKEIADFQDNVDGDKTGWHYGVDLMILLDTIDRGAAHRMARDWNIDDTYLCLGYERAQVGQNEEGLDFTGTLYTVGIRFESKGK